MSSPLPEFDRYASQYRELLGDPLLRAGDFRVSLGCDPSARMLPGVASVEVSHQTDPGQFPCHDGEFDLITAACVYPPVPVVARPALTAEVFRKLKPCGRFAILKHNPWYPATQWIVNRTPMDTDPILLSSSEYLLYLPEGVYRRIGFEEKALSRAPLGKPHRVCGKRPG